MAKTNGILNGLFVFSLLLMLAATSVAPATAENTEVDDVTRVLPESIPDNNELSVVLEIDGQNPLVVGIVETIPKGFAFPENVEDISTSCEFELDRENRKISFSAININSITYNVIASSESETYTFSGNWVDLLYQSTDLNESKERWNGVSGDKSIERESATESSSSSNNSSTIGGGGGSGITGEKYENIATKNVVEKYLSINTEIEYVFNDKENPIECISFTPLINAGFISTVVEVLNDVSVLVNMPPQGDVYKNMNIWVGNDWANSNTVSNPKISFNVNKTWLRDNNIDSSEVKLLRYTTEWTALPTTKTGEDTDKIYYSAETPGFSPFAIVAISEESAGVDATESTADTEKLNIETRASEAIDESPGNEVEETSRATPGFGTFLGIILMMLVFMIFSRMENKR